VAALLAGETIIEAARTAKMSESSARRLVAEPRVKQALADARGQMIAEAVTILSAQASMAAGVLADLAEHGSQEHVRLAAATRVLELTLKGRDLLDIEQRLAALETALPVTTAASGKGR
jgi:hypothetical protein